MRGVYVAFGKDVLKERTSQELFFINDYFIDYQVLKNVDKKYKYN